MVAQNLVAILEREEELNKLTRRFISDWILTDFKEKGKAFYDVWDIVLKNYFPLTRPILFRATDRISRNGKIASFTGRIECARRISGGKGALLICDTNEALKFVESYYSIGEYKHTFYPLGQVLVKAKNNGGWGFSQIFLDKYIREDEYIMRVNFDHIYSFKWSPQNI